MEFIIFLIKCVYIMLPGVFADIIPVIFKKSFKKLAIPVDLGKKFRGKRLFGNNKTYRGFIFGILFSIIIALVQKWLYNFSFFQSISLFDYENTNMVLFGFLMGFGVLFGDLIESFVKRRLDIKPGSSFMPWDQIDSAIGAIVFVSFVYAPPLKVILAALILTFFISLLLSRIGYIFRFRKEKF